MDFDTSVEGNGDCCRRALLTLNAFGLTTQGSSSACSGDTASQPRGSLQSPTGHVLFPSWYELWGYVHKVRDAREVCQEVV